MAIFVPVLVQIHSHFSNRSEGQTGEYTATGAVSGVPSQKEYMATGAVSGVPSQKEYSGAVSGCFAVHAGLGLLRSYGRLCPAA